MAFKTYIPERGDLIHMNWYPSAGQEMQDEHYGLVISPQEFNKKTGLAMTCAATSQITGRDWSFAVLLKSGVLPQKQGQSVDSVILVDQTRAVDFRTRGMKKVANCPRAVVDEVTEILLAIVDPQMI